MFLLRYCQVHQLPQRNLWRVCPLGVVDERVLRDGLEPQSLDDTAHFPPLVGIIGLADVLQKSALGVFDRVFGDVRGD